MGIDWDSGIVVVVVVMVMVAERLVVLISRSLFNCILFGCIRCSSSGCGVNSGCGGSYLSHHFHHYHCQCHHHDNQLHHHLYHTHLCFKQAQPKMCHSPKFDDGDDI